MAPTKSDWEVTLPSIYADDALEIYEMTKDSEVADKTKDYINRRDK